MANPPSGAEGRIYRHFRETQPAPQGIGVMNSAGKVLTWSLMFEDEDQLTAFFVHTESRFQKFPDNTDPVATERFMRFPAHKLPDVPDDGSHFEIPAAHADGETCPGHLPIPEGALPARVFGRAFGDNGEPASNSRSQDNYIEDRFEIPKSIQLKFLKAAEAGGNFAVPIELGRILASNAYLGHLDVNPLGGDQTGAETLGETIELFATANPESPGLFRISGRTIAAGGPNARGRGNDGRDWEHIVHLEWEGFIETADGEYTRVTLAAHGAEKLRWKVNRPAGDENDLAHLPAGRSLDFIAPVRYGVSAGNK
ncbi:MAG: hypothetical protein HKN23_03040 [Verrucomicrobiales bacterium]|nr:hypothetical protein [Verrucomicrobiales bacterium]